MDIRQLSALLAVAEHGTFSAAARALHTVQSNVSTHVARLEDEVGSMLVDRRSGALTAEGEVVAARARRITAEMAAIAPDVAAVRDVIRGQVRVGVLGSTARWLVPPLITGVRREHPDVQLQLIDATTTSLVPQVLSSELDAAIVNLPVDEPGLAARALFDEELVLVVPREHELADRPSVSVAELADHQLLLSPIGTQVRDVLERAAGSSAVELERPLAEIDGMTLLTALAAEGFGPALVPASVAWASGNYQRVPVPELGYREVGLITNERVRPSSTTSAVLDVLERVVRTELESQPGLRHPRPADA